MAKRIRIDLERPLEIPIDGGLVARELGLDVAAFRALMEERRITVLCERGTGEDAGLYRASFYHEGRRARVVVDGTGTPVGPRAGDARGED